MFPYKLKVPHVLLVYTAIVLVALIFTYNLYLKNSAMQNELIKLQDESLQLKNELIKIKRYTAIYKTSPEIVAVVLRESEKKGIDPAIMLELINTESRFNPQAVSRDGARGLCQIKPITARSLSKELGISYDGGALYDVDYNINLGTYYLAKMLEMHEHDYHKALTAYNRGPAGMKAFIKRTGTPASNYSRRISTNSIRIPSI